MHKPRVVILGAGFGGTYTLINLMRRLRPSEAQVTVINRTNYFLFTPLLHEVATGSLAHHNVVESLRSIMRPYATDLMVAEILKVETARKVVLTSTGEVPYDILVVATGSKTNFYGTPGAEEHSFVLKNLYDAIKLRNRIIDCVEKSTTTEDPVERKRLLNFVIVGAGATGVELAAEIADWFFDTFKKFYKHKIDCADISIHLSTDGSAVLPQFHPNLRARSAYILKKKGVNLHFAARAVQIEEKRVVFADGSEIETDTVIWAAGVTPENLPTDVDFVRDSRQRIIVNASLQVQDHPEIFALGDIASFTQRDQTLPMLAQVAVSEAEVVAQNVARSVRNLRRSLRHLRALPLAKFKYKRRGDLVSLGTWQAVADIFGTRWSGPLAWFIWRTVYLMKFSSWSKRIRIAVDWTIDIFYPRDITKA